MDVADGQIPIAALLTGLALGHRPLTDLGQRQRVVRERVRLRKNSRAEKTVYHSEPIYGELTWAEQDRLRERTMVQRVSIADEG